jgi:signal transduction histidine kinase
MPWKVREFTGGKNRMAFYELSDVVAQIRRALVDVFSVSELQNRVVELSQRIFDAEACSLFLMDEDRKQMHMTAALGYAERFLGHSAPFVPRHQVVKNPTSDDQKLGLTGWIASSGQPVMANSIKELKSHPHWRGVYDIAQFGPDKSVHNFYGVPLKVAEDEVVGVLKVEGKQVDGKFQPFTQDDAHIFDILAAHIAIAIANAWHLEKIQQQRAQLQTITNALHKVVAVLSEESSMQILLNEIISTTAEILSAEACVLFLKDDRRNVLVERAGTGYVEHLIGKAEYRLIPREDLVEQPEKHDDRVGLTAWIAITGQPFLARNNRELRAHPHWRGQYDDEHYRSGSDKQCNSFLGVPLTVADKVVGVLKVENKIVDGDYVPFTLQDRQVFETLARSIAIAVGTVQEQRVKREQAVTDAMYRVSQALAGRFDLEPLLAEIVEVGKEIFDAEACVVFLVDQADPTRLIETKGEGYVKHLEDVAEYRLIPREELIERPEQKEGRVGLTAWIAITGQPFLARDNVELQAHPHWRGQYDDEHYPEGSGKKCESFMGLPLRVGGDVLGVLKVENKMSANKYVPFDERDQHIFQLLANSAAIAIRNARDFQRLQEAQGLAAIGMSAAAMAHWMRTPLQFIRTTAELLGKDLKRADATRSQNLKDVKDIVKAVEQMDAAIERVRGAAKPLAPKLEAHNIGEIIRSNFTHNRSYEQQFKKRDIRVKIVDLENLQQRTLQCDRNLLEEAISNLVDNAIASVPDGGHINICIAENGDLLIEVQDDGPGVPESRQKDLFEPFKTTKKGGLGLGLFIVRRNIEAHGGAVSYRQRDQGGASFCIELPQQGRRGG